MTRKGWLGLAVVIALAAGGLAACRHAARPAASAPRLAAGLGTTTVDHWTVQSSAVATAGGAALSTPGYSTAGWYPTGGTSTAFAAVLGQYPGVLTSTRLRSVDAGRFAAPWWYRTELTLTGTAAHTVLRTNGVLSRADVWLNGRRVADRTVVVGAYAVHEFDVGGLVRDGVNALAVQVYPNDADRDLTLGWIDWAPPPPDRDMGVWRPVQFVRTGPVTLTDPHVTTALRVPALDHADVAAVVTVTNTAGTPRTATVTGTLAGHAVRQRVALPARQARTVALRVGLDHPKVWWPNGWGGQPRYDVTLAAVLGDETSDQVRDRFGVRDVRSDLTPQGYRRFTVNGRLLPLRGAGWGGDLLLRDTGYARDLGHARDLGLNLVRLEGRLPGAAFYDLADRDGILVLAGWECCNKWEAGAVPLGSGSHGVAWTDEDYRVAGESMVGAARLLRGHPSVIGFLIGSDWAPPDRTEAVYLEALAAAGWTLPVISSGSDRIRPPRTGPSGLKMLGPYEWVPPVYWYGHQAGAAFGFGSELSAGRTIPPLEALRTFLSPAELAALWRSPSTPQYHSAPSGPFADLAVFDAALSARYGPPRDLADWAGKAQLSNYESARAQFEAYGSRMDAADPATGVVYWMLNAAWPSLNWQLYDVAGGDPAGAYYGAKKANEPVHVQYSYDDRSVVVVNHGRSRVSGLTVTARTWTPVGQRVAERHAGGIAVDGGRTARPLTLPAPAGLPASYFLELALRDGDREVSRNVYWLSTRPDTLNWAGTTLFVTPTTGYADLAGVTSLPTAAVKATASGTTVTLTNTGTVPAFFLHLTLRDGAGAPVLPVSWSDNDVTLFAGQSVTLRARATVHGAPTVTLEGENLPARTLGR
jgi:exo-1,4-beta-D-glucosaminidase